MANAYTESDFTSISANLVHQNTKEAENISKPVQKISVTDHIEKNSKLLTAFWVCFSLGGLLSKDMQSRLLSQDMDFYYLGIYAASLLAIFSPSLLLIMWEVLETFPGAKKSSLRLILFYCSILAAALFLALYLIAPFLYLIPKSPLIEPVIILSGFVAIIAFVTYFSKRSLKPETSKHKAPQTAK